MTSGETYITQRELAARWKLSGRTLERWRAESYGPPYAVLGGSIRYLLADVEQFEEGRRHGGGPQRAAGEGGAQ